MIGILIFLKIVTDFEEATIKISETDTYEDKYDT
jgi:hypothetical protein